MAFDGFQHQTQFLSVDNELVDKIVNKLKSQGIFDQFRKDCLADVDSKPAYQHLQQRVNGSVSVFLKSKKWKQDLNKTQLRESLRHHVQQGFLQAGVDRIVDQVVNSKIYSVFMPKVEDMVYETLGIEKPKKIERVKGTTLAPKTEEIPKEEPKLPEKEEEVEEEEELSPPGESPKRPQDSPKIPDEPPKAPTPIPGVSTELIPIIPSEDEADKDDSNTIDETPFLLASLKNKENENSNSKISSEISIHTIHEISSTTESLATKTPIKTNTPKLDNFSNLSEKLKQFDPLAQPVKNDEKPDIKNFPEDDTSSSMQIDESNGFNDSNIEFERLLSEDSKSSMSDFKKYKASKTDKIEDSLNDSNLENKIKKPDIKKSEKRESSSNRSKSDSEKKDSKSSHSRSSKHKHSSKDKDRKDDKKSSKDDKHRSSASHKHKSDKHDDKKKKDDKRESRKRKNERCSDSKSKESRRSSDRDNSGSGHSSKKSSRSEHKSSNKSSSSKSKEPEQKNSQDVQDSVDGLNEVDLILMKINSSIEEEMALEPKKTKFAKNIHEAKKINAKKVLDKQKTEPDDIVNNKENLTGNNVFLTHSLDTQKSFNTQDFNPIIRLTDCNKPDKISAKLIEKNQEILEKNNFTEINTQDSNQTDIESNQSEDEEDFLGFDPETIQKAIAQLQTIKDNMNCISSYDKMNNNLDKSRKRSNIEPIPVESKKLKELDVEMDSMDDVETDESSSLTEAMLNNLLKETSTVQIPNDDSNTSTEIAQKSTDLPIKQSPKEDKPEKKISARNEKRRRSNRTVSRYSAQRYDSTDLYKPRVVLSQSSRRSRGDTNTLNTEVLDEKKRLR